MRLADGAPLVALSRLLGTPLRQRVAGADLLEPICAAVASQNLSVYLLGGKPGAAGAAARRLAQTHPGLRVAAQCPPPRFDDDPDATKAVLADIRRVAPNVLFVCLGAPKQEKWIAAHLDTLPPVVAVCAGAAVDFYSGATRRAPLLWQRLGFEWLYRLLHEPRRLGPRYLGRDWAFVGIAARDLWSSRRSGTAGRCRSGS
jgi:N-acetylglucosaminyldiphosphoundecaprenol N-acetyl-beta-D-mannosaminyltransferase